MCLKFIGDNDEEFLLIDKIHLSFDWENTNSIQKIILEGVYSDSTMKKDKYNKQPIEPIRITLDTSNHQAINGTIMRKIMKYERLDDEKVEEYFKNKDFSGVFSFGKDHQNLYQKVVELNTIEFEINKKKFKLDMSQYIMKDYYNETNQSKGSLWLKKCQNLVIGIAEVESKLQQNSSYYLSSEPRFKPFFGVIEDNIFIGTSIANENNKFYPSGHNCLLFGGLAHSHYDHNIISYVKFPKKDQDPQSEKNILRKVRDTNKHFKPVIFLIFYVLG